MGWYLARRLAFAVPTLVALSLLIFILVSMAPGDPAEQRARTQALGQDVTPEQIAQAREELGLDRPFVEQFVSWLGGAFQGDLGKSFSRRTPVWDEIRGHLGATGELAGAAFLLTIVLSLPLGIAAAVLYRTWLDHALRLVALVGASVPNFFLAYLLMVYFATRLGLFPVGGRSGLESLVLPAVTLAVAPIAIVSRLLRSSLLEVFQEDYVRTAQAKGVSQLVVVARHGLRNAAVPTVTVLGWVLGRLLEGTIIAEVIFAWPGIGRLTYEAINQRDYPMVQGLVLFAGLAFFLVNLLVDLSYRLIDPRIRLGAAAA